MIKRLIFKNRNGEIYNDVKIDAVEVDAYLNKEFNSYKDAEQCTVEITDVPSDDEIKLSKKAQRNAIRSIKNANNIAQLKVALIELIKYLDIGEENE